MKILCFNTFVNLWCHRVCSLTKWHQYIFSISLKFGACYIMGQWGKFRVKNGTICLHILFWYSVFVVFYHKICVCLKFPQQNINKSEMWIGGFQLLVELYAYDAYNLLIICRQTLWLTTLDMMNMAMLNCYECMNLI